MYRKHTAGKPLSAWKAEIYPAVTTNSVSANRRTLPPEVADSVEDGYKIYFDCSAEELERRAEKNALYYVGAKQVYNYLRNLTYKPIDDGDRCYLLIKKTKQASITYTLGPQADPITCYSTVPLGSELYFRTLTGPTTDSLGLVQQKLRQVVRKKYPSDSERTKLFHLAVIYEMDKTQYTQLFSIAKLKASYLRQFPNIIFWAKVHLGLSTADYFTLVKDYKAYDSSVSVCSPGYDLSLTSQVEDQFDRMLADCRRLTEPDPDRRTAGQLNIIRSYLFDLKTYLNGRDHRTRKYIHRLVASWLNDESLLRSPDHIDPASGSTMDQLYVRLASLYSAEELSDAANVSPDGNIDWSTIRERFIKYLDTRLIKKHTANNRIDGFDDLELRSKGLLRDDFIKLLITCMPCISRETLDGELKKNGFEELDEIYLLDSRIIWLDEHPTHESLYDSLKFEYEKERSPRIEEPQR